MTDLPDYTTTTSVNADVAVDTTVEIRPKGGKLIVADDNTLDEMFAIVSYVIPLGKTFNLAKTTISVEKATYIAIAWDMELIAAIRMLDDMSILIDHYPKDYAPMVGDDNKAFEIYCWQVEESGQISVDVSGEEIDT